MNERVRCGIDNLSRDSNRTISGVLRRALLLLKSSNQYFVHNPTIHFAAQPRKQFVSILILFFKVPFLSSK